MSKSRLAAVLSCAALLLLSLASPALGGPSLSSVVKTAKKALSTAKKADSRARGARSRAESAYGLATQANTNASTAMQRGQITLVRSPQVPFSSTSVVQSAQAFCPAGQKVISGGGVAIADQELAASDTNDSRTGWFVMGIDEVDNGGEYVQATALCAPSGQAVAASRGKARAEVARRVRELERAIASKSCSAGYTRAIMPDRSQKCLRAGQFCSHRPGWQRTYHRYGFHCKRNGHLTVY